MAWTDSPAPRTRRRRMSPPPDSAESAAHWTPHRPRSRGWKASPGTLLRAGRCMSPGREAYSAAPLPRSCSFRTCNPPSPRGGVGGGVVLELSLESAQHRVALRDIIDLKTGTRIDLIRRHRINEVLDQVDKAAHLGCGSCGLDPDRDITVQRRFRLQVGVSALEGGRRLVRAVGEEVEGRWRAEPSSHVEYQRHGLRQVVQHTQIAGDRAPVALGGRVTQVGIGVDIEVPVIIAPPK